MRPAAGAGLACFKRVSGERFRAGSEETRFFRGLKQRGTDGKRPDMEGELAKSNFGEKECSRERNKIKSA